MKNLILKPNLFDNFFKCSKEAKKLATDKNRNVEFEFNGITCVVSKDTNLDWLHRDYGNAHTMEWKTVGADCLPEYAPKIKAELEKRHKLAEKEAEKRHREYKKKEEKEKKAFNQKVSGIKMELSDADGWAKGRAKNTDPYGSAAYDYAEGWAKLMQVEIKKGAQVAGCAESTSHQLGFMGITGFMYGCAVSVLSQCWKHGEELRKWHNKEYGHKGKGVVNPAVMTIGS